MKQIPLSLGVSALIGTIFAPNSVSAAVYSSPSALGQTVPWSTTKQVNWRPYYHCHRDYYRGRWCHGGPRYYEGGGPPPPPPYPRPGWGPGYGPGPGGPGPGYGPGPGGYGPGGGGPGMGQGGGRGPGGPG